MEPRLNYSLGDERQNNLKKKINMILLVVQQHSQISVKPWNQTMGTSRVGAKKCRSCGICKQFN